MSKEYVDNAVAKIIKEKSFPENIALATSWILGNFKALNLKVLDLKKESSLADFFVLATASNMTQASSMAEEIIKQLKKHGCSIYSKEGVSSSDWTLIDGGDIIVHIFVGPAREVYDLDGLWTHCPRLEIPTEYYFTTPDSESDSSSKGYF